ncbi:MAG: SDR family oxidoreductase [Burkholderiales bacterium]
MKDLDGKIALVSGAGSGIGRAAALAFAGRGATVIVSGRTPARLRQSVDLIANAGGAAVSKRADVTKPAQVRALVEFCLKRFGRLDYAFNNAGVEGDVADTVRCSEANWGRVIDTNLRGVWLCMKYEIPAMLKNGGGAIVNNCSEDGLNGAPNAPAYCASKHGVIGLTKTAALEYAHLGVRVNAVCPGWIKTEMSARFIKDNAEIEEALHNSHPIGRMGTAEEVAAAVLWLCSDAASFVTGHALSVDGGSMAGRI